MQSQHILQKLITTSENQAVFFTHRESATYNMNRFGLWASIWMPHFKTVGISSSIMAFWEKLWQVLEVGFAPIRPQKH